MAMDDDWVDVAEEFCTREEWVLLVGDEGAMSAVFFGRAAAGIGGTATPIPVAAPAAAAASCRGLVLFAGAWSRFYVFDPSAAARHHTLPLPTRTRARDAAIARDGAADGYSVVCAFDGCFEIYSSASGDWREVPSPSAAAGGGVVAGSAAAFAGRVFWKTAAASSSAVLALDVASGATAQIAAPPGSSAPAALWQLGVAAGHLCAAVCNGDTIELYGLADGDEWSLLYAIVGLALDESPRPLRFESDNHEVLLRAGGGRVVALDMVKGTTREAQLEGSVLPERDEGIVPWCRAPSTVML